MDVDRFEDLPILPASRARPRRHSRYRVGPLHAVSEPLPVTVAGSIRAGALTGLSIVAALGIPVFLVLGARAPAWQDRADPPSAEVANVWAESAVPVRPAATVVAAAGEARPETVAPIPVAPLPVAPLPVASRPVEPEPSRVSPAARSAEARPALSLDLIPVLDDESGDLSFEEAVTPAPKTAPRPGRVSATAPRSGPPARP